MIRDWSLDLPPNATQNGTSKQQAQHVVALPAGGTLVLQDHEEVVMWNDAMQRYMQDYSLVKANDLILLGAILSQALIMYRAQNELLDPKKAGPAQTRIQKAAEEIRNLEKALGIDKKTREQGGKHTVSDYVTTLKRAAHEKGIRIAERTKAYEAFMMELRWKLRLLRNGDVEDRRHHGLTKDTILAWAEGELARLEEEDKKWAREKGRVFVGRL